MPTLLQHAITLLARVLLSLIFLVSGAAHLLDWNATTSYMRAKGMAMEGVLGSAGPVAVHIMLAVAIVLLLVGGRAPRASGIPFRALPAGSSAATVLPRKSAQESECLGVACEDGKVLQGQYACCRCWARRA